MTSSSAARRIEKLPDLLSRKLYKTGQTRGATVREIYQNRVSRNSTVLIPFTSWQNCRVPDDDSYGYENGFIVLVSPVWYFETRKADAALAELGLSLGNNALLLFQRRSTWMRYAPDIGTALPNGMPFTPATSRISPLGGTFMARVHSTTASTNGSGIVQGYNETSSRGAGIRVYEYASAANLESTRLQLEALVWLCHDAETAMVEAQMTAEGARIRKEVQLSKAEAAGLMDMRRLRDARMINSQEQTICPLCLELISASDFLKRGEQAEGRETWDITVTEVSLFHIDELRVGRLQHKPYNLGWGHHFCNVVVKDSGIIPTLKWMKIVLDNNGNSDEVIAEENRLVEQAVNL